MEKVYCSINSNTGDVNYICKNLADLQELVMDDFFENYQMEMQEAADAHWIEPMNPSKDCSIYATDTWRALMGYHCECNCIQEDILL